MKNLLMMLILIISVACGKSNGGGSSDDVPTPITPVDVVYEYRIYVVGDQGTSFVSNATVNFGESDQSSTVFSYTIDQTLTQNIAVFGKSIFWEIQKTSGSDIEVFITRDGVEVSRQTISQDNVVITISNNI